MRRYAVGMDGTGRLAVRTKVFGLACVLCVAVAVGVVGAVVVDIDHIPQWMGLIDKGRAWHPPFAVAGAIALVLGSGCLVACYRRLSQSRLLAQGPKRVQRRKPATRRRPALASAASPAAFKPAPLPLQVTEAARPQRGAASSD